VHYVSAFYYRCYLVAKAACKLCVRPRRVLRTGTARRTAAAYRSHGAAVAAVAASAATATSWH